ncbi:unnamed protein product [Rotaria socialis]|uniref:Translational activator of cytochrome c oxidase 1 n=1 Tax=Rotaria socialis TaxID=392032 RepID=A0A817LJ81_9BILA|nr:unnamed protein product [Rotaria socialis]CAF3305862.1 unnamed protein product [Rotaria socialis]CAF3329018.1 unnamed protein product [Rotaria socialis]CAF3611987.1 unnamed protein product [Rotaria socialis]CAF3718002.1 unnamed protein product [Rotaria socialis]
MSVTNLVRYCSLTSKLSCFTTRSLLFIQSSNCDARRYAGHAHWQNIAKTKSTNDQLKGRIIGKLSTKIVTSIRQNGNVTDPQYNAVLRATLEECRKNNMPKETIDRAIKRAIAQKDNTKQTLFEFVGPGRAFCIIEMMTENPKRSFNYLNKSAAKIGIPEISKSGQIAEYFDQRGYACIEKADITEDKATELAIEINAEEVIEALDDDGERTVWKFLGPPTFYGQMKVNLTQRGYTVTCDGSEFIPKVTVPLNDRDKALLKQIISMFEELEQVEGVHTNAA